MGNKVKQEKIWIHTGSDLLDLVLGGGAGVGLPAGKIVNFVGDKSSGKTFLACEIIAAAYQQYGKRLKWNYDDVENGFTFNTMKLYGIDIGNPGWETFHSHTVEEMEYHYKKFINQLKTDEIGIYIVDSLDGLSSDENEKRGDARYKSFEDGKEFKEGSYQVAAPKYLSQEFFKRMVDLTSKRNILFIMISQVRENIDPYSFGKYKRNGGKALDFYAYAVLWLATNRKILKKDRAIGVFINAKTEKLKAPRPFRECDINLLFEYGLDNIGSNVDWLFGYRTEKGELRESMTAAWDSSEGKAKQDLNSVKRFLKEQEVWEAFVEENSNKPKLVEVMTWINERPKLLQLFEKNFGQQYTREGMIKFIEDNNLQSELTERVQNKWEEIEESIKLERKPKYQD